MSYRTRKTEEIESRAKRRVVAIGAWVLSATATVPTAIAQPFAYVSNLDDGTVSVVDTATATVLDEIAVGNLPYGVAVHPDGSRAYVSNSEDGTVSVIDTSTNTVVATVPVTAPDPGPGWGVAVHPDGSVLYATDEQSGTLAIVDTATNSVIDRITVGGDPAGVAVHPQGTFAYVANTNSSSVSVVDTALNAVVAEVPLGAGFEDPFGIAVHPSGAFVYVTRGGLLDSIDVIDTALNTVVDTIPVDNGPVAIAVHPDGTRVYVANEGGETVSVIDSETNQVIATVVAPQDVTFEGLSVHPSGKTVYAAEFGALGEKVAIIDTGTNTIIREVDVGRSPAAFGEFIGPAPSDGVSCEITMSQSVYTDGEVVTANSVRLRNEGIGAVPVEAKLWIERPIGAPLADFNGGADGSLVLPPGFDADVGPRALGSISPSLLRGTYQYNCRVLDPVSGSELTSDFNEFEVR